MDFRLDDDQLALQELIARFCTDRYPIDGFSQRPTTETLDRAAWHDLAELGVLSLLVSDVDGGLGLGVVEAAVVFEQLGKHLVPGPWDWSSAVAGLVDGVSEGRTVVGGVQDHGGLAHLEHPHDLDALVAVRPDGIYLIESSELGPITDRDALDPFHPVGTVEHLPAGRRLGGPDEAAAATDLVTVLSAATLLGIAQSALDVAVGYSLERHQFGVPIASFQALKHIMADMYVRVGLARSSTYAAAAVLDDPVVGDRGRSVSAAKLLAGEAALANARAAVQVLGGMGFTWDMPPNFLLKRAWALEHRCGTGAEHAERLAAAVAAGVN